jgi:type I restriction enzyme, S subunit
VTSALVRVADVAEQVRGVTYDKDDISATPRAGYLPVLRAGNIGDEGLSFEDLVFVPAERISPKQRIRKGDVLVAASSGSLDIVGKAARALADYEGGFGAFCKVLRPGPGIDPSYFAHFFKTQDYRRRVSALAAGININNLRNEHLDEMQIPLPPVAEQRRIAEALDKAEALVAKRRVTLAQLDTLTQAMFVDMFGDPATNLKGFPSSTIGSVSEQVTDGEHLTPKRAAEGIKLLSARNIRDGYIDFENVDYIGLEEYERIKRRCNPSPGDVLISCSGTIGRVASVETREPFSLVRSAALVRPRPSVVRYKFLEYYLRTPALKARMLRRANASSQANLFQGQLRDLPVYVPPISLQDDFTIRVARVDTLKAAHWTSLAGLHALFASLQHRAFQGDW